MIKKLALIGVTGKKSGSVLVELLSSNIDNMKDMFPDGIMAITRESSNTSNLLSLIPDIEIRKGSTYDEDFLNNCFSGVDTIIHISGIKFSKEIVKAAAEKHVRRLILVHTTGVYSKYKAAGEEYRITDEYVYKVCKEHNIVLTICRPTMIYGNIYDNNVITFIRMVDKLPIMPVVNGAHYELQPVHYADLGAAYYSILINESITANKDYILSGGKPILLRDMFIVIGNNLGKNVRFINCPYPFAYVGAWIIYMITFGKIDLREKVQRLCEPRAYSHEEARNDFGYAPREFEDGIKDEITEYRKHTPKY